MKKVTLQVSEEFYAFAELQAEQFEHIDTRHYLNGLLNMALLTAAVDAGGLEGMPYPLPIISVTTEQHQIRRLGQEKCKHGPVPVTEIEEDEGGGIWHKDELDAIRAAEEADLDDDIPF